MNILNIVKLEEKAVSPHRKNGEGTGISSRTNNLQKRARVSEYMFAVMMKFKRVNMVLLNGNTALQLSIILQTTILSYVQRTK